MADYHYEVAQVLNAIEGTDFLKGVVSQKLHTMTSGECWSLYRAIVKLAHADLEHKLEREMDLVRYQRSELFDAELISEDEYAALVADSENGQRVARLESYDAIRKLSEARQAAECNPPAPEGSKP